MSEGSIELRNVTKRFGEITAVDAVSLQIREGEFFSLLGPSGCGKTTTLRLIAGFEQPSSGDVLLEGQSVSGIPPHKRNVNTVFQSYALFPHLSVAENIAFGLKMKRVAKPETKARVEEALDLVELAGLGSRRPSELSGGQQQRVALARALVNHPSILLLDEPLAALDLKLRKQMQIELKSLQRKVGITFVYVTHDQGEALSLSDRLAVMHEGGVLQVGTPSDLYEYPANHFVADFIGQSNFLPGVITECEADVLTMQVSDTTLSLKAPGQDGCQPGQQVTLAIRPERIQVSDALSQQTGNQLPGMVDEVMYLGTVLQYAVTISESVRMLIHQPNLGNATTERYVRGTAVTLTWAPEHGVILASAEARKE